MKNKQQDPDQDTVELVVVLAIIQIIITSIYLIYSNSL